MSLASTRLIGPLERSSSQYALARCAILQDLRFPTKSWVKA